MMTDTTPATHLGPARVLKARGPRLRAAIDDREVDAVLATPFPYQPSEGDTVLVIGQEDSYYVIGIIQGRGRTVFTAPGDLEFRAPQGRIEFASPRGVAIRGGEVSIKAGRLEVLARSIVERFVEAWRCIQGAFQLRAQRVRQVVEDQYQVVAGAISETADKDVKIDGDQIHLG